jgi:hypothetical protein
MGGAAYDVALEFAKVLNIPQSKFSSVLVANSSGGDIFRAFSLLFAKDPQTFIDYHNKVMDTLQKKYGYEIIITPELSQSPNEAIWKTFDGSESGKVYKAKPKGNKFIYPDVTPNGIKIPDEFKGKHVFDYNASLGQYPVIKDELVNILINTLGYSSSEALNVLAQKDISFAEAIANAIDKAPIEIFPETAPSVYRQLNYFLSAALQYDGAYYKVAHNTAKVLYSNFSKGGDHVAVTTLSAYTPKAQGSNARIEPDKAELPVKVKRAIYKRLGDEQLPAKEHARFIREFNAAPNALAKLSVAKTWFDDIEDVIENVGYEAPELKSLGNHTGFVTPQMLDFWKEHGVLPTEIIGYNGTEYEVIDAKGDDIVARFLGNDTEVIIPKDQITKFDRLRLSISELLPAVEGHGPKTIKSAYPKFKAWVDEQREKLAKGEDIDVDNIPPIPFVRNQQSANRIEFSPVRKGIWASFAEADGDNNEYRKYASGLTDEGGEHPFWGLLKLQNPLVIINSTYPSSTGKAILKELAPDLLKNKAKAESVFISMLGQAEFEKYNYKHFGYPFSDRLGREIARQQGYKEVINLGSYETNGELAILYPESEMLQHQITDVELQDMTQAEADAYLKDYLKDIVDQLDDDEKVLYYDNVKRLATERKQKNADITSSLTQRGLTVRALNDKLAIMDGDKVVDTVDSVEELKESLNKLGHFNNGDIIPPPPTTDPLVMNSDNDGPDGKIKIKRNFLANLRNFANLSLAKIVPTKDLFITLEDTYGKRFFHDFWLPLQQAKLKYNVELQPWLDKIHALKPIAELSPERKTLMYHAFTQFSKEELLGDKPSILARPLTAEEQSIGKLLAEKTKYADRRKAYEYFKAKRELENELASASKKDAADIQAKFDDTWKNFTEAELTAIDQMGKMRMGGLKRSSIYAAFSLADAIEFDTPTRAEFMKRHKFSALEKAGVEQIEKIFKDLAPVMDIEDYRTLGGYITRMKQYDGTVADGSLLLREKDLATKERDFVYAMTRTGETVDYITDPVEVLQRYLTYGMKVKHLYPEVANATKFLVDTYKGMDQDVAHGIHELASRYLNEIRGFRNPTDALALAGEYDVAKDAFTRMAAKAGLNKETTGKWLSTYLRVSELATQGFKPIAGIRDATSTLMYYAARFGFKRAAKMMSMWSKAMEVKEGLRKEGVLPGLNVNLLNLIDGQLTKETYFSKLAELGFKYSGQPAVFLQSHAMTYLEHLSTGNSAVTDYISRKIGKDGLVKRLALDTFDNIIQKEFWKKLETQPAKAVEYLADIAGRDMVGHYGMANHPLFMQSKVGKVIGQHGQWPLWMAQNFGRMLAQGGVKRNIGTAARLAIMMAAMDAAGEEAGFNLKSWLLSPHNTVFTGGPLAQTGLWAAMAVGSNYPPTQQFAQFMLGRQVQLDRPQYFLPIPSQAYFILEAWQRAAYGQPAHIVFGRMMGIPVDYEQYPRPE